MAYLTDNEIVERYEFFTMQLEQRLLNGENYKNLIDQIPSIAILSRSDDIEILYTNKRHEELTGYALEEVRNECKQYLEDIVHPKSLAFVRSYLSRFYKTSNPCQTTPFIQYVRLNGSSEYTPLVTFAKPSNITDGLVLRMPLLPEELKTFLPKFEQIIKMDQFRLKHFKKFQTLTEREIEILKLLANGSNNPGIAEQLFISRQTVETHRKNIKRKLDIRSYRDLVKYAFAFNLISL